MVLSRLRWFGAGVPDRRRRGRAAMDGNNWRRAQDGGNPGNNWRAQLSRDSRNRIVNKILDTLKKHLPISGPDGLVELQKIAVRFEEKIYTLATSQTDYLRRISVKMLTMETKSQNSVANSSGFGGQNTSDPGSGASNASMEQPTSPRYNLRPRKNKTWFASNMA